MYDYDVYRWWCARTGAGRWGWEWRLSTRESSSASSSRTPRQLWLASGTPLLHASEADAGRRSYVGFRTALRFPPRIRILPSICKKSKKNLDLYNFVTYFLACYLVPLKTDVTYLQKVKSKKILSATNEKSRILIRIRTLKSVVWIHGFGSRTKMSRIPNTDLLKVSALCIFFPVWAVLEKAQKDCVWH